MVGLQGCNDVDEACSFSLVHLHLSHPAVRIGFRDDSLCFVEFGAMHFEERGVGAEMSAVEASIRVRTRSSYDWDGAVAIR
jgi:hypothetical protein